MAILRQFMVLGFWLLSYIYMKNMDLKNKMDINRRDYNLNLIEVVLWNGVLMVMGMVVVFCVGLLLMRDPRVLIGALVVFDVILVTISIWIIGIFVKGFYVNTDLTEHEAIAPRESLFVMLFYFFARTYSFFLFLGGLVIMLIQPFAACGLCALVADVRREGGGEIGRQINALHNNALQR